MTDSVPIVDDILGNMEDILPESTRPPLPLRLVAVIVAMFATMLLMKVYERMKPKVYGRWDASLQNMINGYDFKLPKESHDYRKLKEGGEEDKYVPICLLMIDIDVLI